MRRRHAVRAFYRHEPGHPHELVPAHWSNPRRYHHNRRRHWVRGHQIRSHRQRERSGRRAMIGSYKVPGHYSNPYRRRYHHNRRRHMVRAHWSNPFRRRHHYHRNPFMDGMDIAGLLSLAAVGGASILLAGWVPALLGKDAFAQQADGSLQPGGLPFMQWGIMAGVGVGSYWLLDKYGKKSWALASITAVGGYIAYQVVKYYVTGQVQVSGTTNLPKSLVQSFLDDMPQANLGAFPNQAGLGAFPVRNAEMADYPEAKYPAVGGGYGASPYSAG